MTDPAMPPDLDRLLGAATVPAMSAGLIDRIVAEAQRPDRAALPVAPPHRAQARAWTRRGMRTGIVAVGLMLATAVAAAFGGGALSMAKIRAVAQHVVERIRHPFHHALPRAAPAHSAVYRMTVPAEAIRLTPAPMAPGGTPHAFVPPSFAPHPVQGPAFVAHPLPKSAHPERGPAFARARAPSATGHALAHPILGHRPEVPHRARRDPDLDRPPVAAPVEPRRDPLPSATATIAPQRDAGLRGDGGARFDGPQWRDPARFGPPAGPHGPGWRRRLSADGGVAGDGARAPGWRRRAGPLTGMRMRPFRPGGGRRPRRF